MRSFKPSPSRSATCNWLIIGSTGKISWPLKPNVLVPVAAAAEKPKINDADSTAPEKNFMNCCMAATCQPTTRLARLFADEVQRHAARMWPCAVFPQIDSLPRSEREPASVNRDGKIHRRQRGADVRGHVVVALSSVAEERIAVAHEPREKGVQIAAHIRVGIFLDQQRGGSVAQMQREQPVAKFIFGNPLRHFIREFNQTAPARGDDDFVKRLAHGTHGAAAGATGAP